MADEERDERHQLSASVGISASDKVWKIFISIVVTAVMGVGGFGYSNLQAKYESLNSQILALQKKVIVLESVGDDDKRELEKQVNLERDKRRKKELEDHIKARAEKLKRISQADESLAGGDGPAASRN